MVFHREEYTLAGKTGTAEIKLSKEDATGTELGWMAVFTTDPNIENPILLISMVEDVKNIGGSGYVVQKIKEYWINIYDRNEMKKGENVNEEKMLAIILVSF